MEAVREIMNCQERRELMYLYAADLLEEGQQQEIRAHVATGCPRCAGALAEAEASLAQIPASIEPVAPPPAALDRLMNRVASGQSRGSGRSGWAIALAACIGLVIGGFALHFAEKGSHQQSMDDALALVADRDQQLGELQTMLQSQQLKLIGFESPAPPTQATAAPTGRILWDVDHHRWHVYVFDLKPPPQGKTYELWFITPDQKKVPAGTFATDASGKGAMVVQLPADIGPIALAAITDEPAGGVQQPTGSIQLVGKLN
jgi:anti-sigma-K factor RskA